jgi:hypothetical protein
VAHDAGHERERLADHARAAVEGGLDGLDQLHGLEQRAHLAPLDGRAQGDVEVHRLAEDADQALGQGRPLGQERHARVEDVAQLGPVGQVGLHAHHPDRHLKVHLLDLGRQALVEQGQVLGALLGDGDLAQRFDQRRGVLDEELGRLPRRVGRQVHHLQPLLQLPDLLEHVLRGRHVAVHQVVQRHQRARPRVLHAQLVPTSHDTTRHTAMSEKSEREEKEKEEEMMTTTTMMTMKGEGTRSWGWRGGRRGWRGWSGG